MVVVPDHYAITNVTFICSAVINITVGNANHELSKPAKIHCYFGEYICCENSI